MNPMTDKPVSKLVSAEGWHVLHLFYKVEAGQWSLLSSEEQIEAKTQLSELVAEIRATEKVQLQVRMDAFNSLNHTNLSGFSTDASASSFGRFTNTRGARVAQLNARLTF